MPEDTSDPASSESTPSESFSPSDGGARREGPAAFDEPASPLPSTSVAVDVARLWVQEHQKASMLGAFATGVFLGAMLRD